MKLTKQGVRDLNGPKFDGSGGYTGTHLHRHPNKRRLKCLHPVREEIYEHVTDEFGLFVVRRTFMYKCTTCGERCP